MRAGTEEHPGWGVSARIPHLSHKTCQKCREGLQGKRAPVRKKCPLKTVALVVKLRRKSLAKAKQPKVARVELRAGGGLNGPEKPGWSAGGMEK